MFELFEHTADVGLRVVTPDLPSLFRDAAQGLFALIVEEMPRSRETRSVEVRLEADRVDFLLVDWLNELLYLFDTKHWLLDGFEVDVRGTRLEATALARPLDEARDRLLHEVKAVTYHGLRVEATPDGWLAEVILDI